MIDQAKFFNCSPSFISAIETGDKHVPEGYVDKFCLWLSMSPSTKKQLQMLADIRTPNVIRFTPLNKEKAAAARRLFRKINKMTPAQIRNLESSIFEDDK
jgi:hypothetical protein